MGAWQRPPEDGAPVVLVVLDGWGIGRDEPGNAVLAAGTPTMDRLLASYPNARLRCSGEDVGLPAGQMGNSEVGHLNLGAGFVVYQWLTRIDKAIADGELTEKPALLAAFEHARRTGGAVHFLGLVSDGGVHSHVAHLEALLGIAKGRGVERVLVHAFTDGRDTSPTAGLACLHRLESAMAETGLGRVATVSGRYYAMDRDHRWERTKRAYDAVVHGVGATASSASEAMRRSYDTGVTDEFVEPAALVGDGAPPATLGAGDSAVFFNFRADRMRQIVKAVVLPGFDGFARGPAIPDLFVATMARYEEDLPVHVLLESHDVARPVGRAVSEAGLAQFHAAETEKYAHVTFFFNGGREEPFPGEERVLVPSPKVATYDLQPEMSAGGVTDAVVEAIGGGRFRFVIVNFANCDMVGHTGVFAAAVAAVETVDRCLGLVVEATLAAGGIALVTADHGNAEEMIDRATGRPMTAHTTNPVPVVLVAPEGHPLRRGEFRREGRLCAVAPTVLRLAGVPVPADMTEPSLVVSPGGRVPPTLIAGAEPDR
jgi:2,3-bisphosphoglycerate-independent phosphoglycerate mutase